MPSTQVELMLCDGCGICVSVCPAFVLELFDRKVTMVNPRACLGTGQNSPIAAPISRCGRKIKELSNNVLLVTYSRIARAPFHKLS